MSNTSLKNKVAVISGSSTGIGFAIASELANRGANIVINYPFPKLKQETEKRLEELLNKCQNVQGIAVQADLSTIEGPEKLINESIKKFGKINILVNNAALAVNKPFEEQNLEEWDLLVNLNGRGAFLLTQKALPYLTKPSRVINICSASSRAAPPLQTIYAGTKGMVDSFTKVWAKELPKKYGCTVNSISPGPTNTEGFSTAGSGAMKVLQPIIDMTPVEARMGEPKEIAYAVAVLADDQSSWINGIHLHVNGGLHIE